MDTPMSDAAIPLNRPTAPIGRRNAVLRARSRVHSVRDFPGPLSIKSVTEGTVVWKTGGRDLAVDRDSFLVLNQGEPYSLDIESRTPVATLCVFFEPGFVEGVRTSLTTGDPDAEPAPPGFVARLHPRDARILPRLEAIAASPPASGLWLDEQYLELAADLALLDWGVRQRLRTMPARRAGTREELLRRVLRAQEFVHAHADGDLSLAAIAREACLSPYHFHRAFTRAFGQTPHEYRTALRLARARRLLESTDLSVTEVCSAVGFESPTSFALLYRRVYGAPPCASRARHLARLSCSATQA
jgi:AraC-like DNA-binding protein